MSEPVISHGSVVPLDVGILLGLSGRDEHQLNLSLSSPASQCLADVLVHTVDGTAYLISPGVFQRYAQEHLQVAKLAKSEELPGWQWVQKRFEKLGLHRKQGSGLNIWTCEVKGPRKSRRAHGYLLLKPETLFDEVPLNNAYLHLQETEE